MRQDATQSSAADRGPSPQTLEGRPMAVIDVPEPVRTEVAWGAQQTYITEPWRWRGGRTQPLQIGRNSRRSTPCSAR